VQLYSPTAARHADKYDAAISVYTIDSQAPENTSHFAMRITLFSSLVYTLVSLFKSSRLITYRVEG